ncbi:hypothetical protein AB0C51_12515 [Streptomyces pathocidini]
MAFDALYTAHAATLARQTFLLTGRREPARESVERAFQLAWQRWPEVAVDRDPAGWVRAAAYEYALSPWHRLRPGPRRAPTTTTAATTAAGDAETGDPVVGNLVAGGPVVGDPAAGDAEAGGPAARGPMVGDPAAGNAEARGPAVGDLVVGDPAAGNAEVRDALIAALLALPDSYRRTLLLHDGVGLGLPETAAEVEASSAATAGRLAHARDAVAELVPGLAGTPPERRGEALRALLAAAAAELPADPALAPAPSVRAESERRTLRTTRAGLGAAALFATAMAVAIAVTTIW